MLRYGLEQVGVTNDYYIIDNFRKGDKFISMINGYEFAKPIVDLLNEKDSSNIRSLNTTDSSKASSLGLLNFRNFLSSVLQDYVDEDLKKGKVFIRSNNGFYYDLKALQLDDGDFYITFCTVPSFYEEDSGELLDYSSYLSSYGYDDMSPEAFMIGEAYDSLESDSVFVDLLDVDGEVLGRFSLHDSLTITDSAVIIYKDYDVSCNQGYNFSYIVDLKDIHSLSF